jgi:hypothetical protein
MASGTTAAKASPAKYDNQIAAQLTRAESRIRTLDLAAGGLGLAALLLLFAVVMAFFDSKLSLSAAVRQAALLAFLVGTGVYTWFAVVQPLRRRINPYYAALKVEALIPGAKNSLVNWVDLHSANLPPAIRAAVGQKAAKDLTRADVEKAVSGKRAGWAGGVAAASLVLFIIAWLLLGRSPFFSLLGRAFAPFGVGGIATRNAIEILRPAGGDATLPVGRSFTVLADVRGPLPDPKSPAAVRLLYRYDPTEPYLERLLQFDQGQGWTTTLPRDEVRDGFWYRVAAGDAATPEYRVRYRAGPAITDFLATYHFRPYVARADEVRHDRELKALRGTQVHLRVLTNRTLREAHLEWEGRDEPIPGKVDANDPQTFEIDVVLKDEGKYRLAFTPTDEDPFIEPTWFAVTPIPDLAPEVKLTLPGTDVKLPANGLLELEGTATDDIGIKSITLRSRIVTGENLKPKPYRGEDGLKLEKGGYPVGVGYKDFLDLAKVESEAGKPVALRPGTELEYWLEAADACDFDRPHVTPSKRFRVQIIEPENDAARQKQREQAERDAKKHQQEQDRKLQEENRQKEQDRKQQEAANAEEQKKSAKAREEQDGGKSDKPSEGDPGKKKDTEEPKGDNTKPEDGGRKSNPGDELSKQDREKEQRLKDALEHKDDAEDGKGGQSKSDPKENPGEGKDGGAGEKEGSEKQGGADQKPDGEGKKGDKADGDNAAEGKPSAQSDAAGKQGEGKSQGNSDPLNGREGEGKRGEERSGTSDGPKGADKPHDGKTGAGKQNEGESKKGDKADQQNAGEGKPQGKSDGGENQGAGKPQGKSDPMAGREGEGKQGGEQANAGKERGGADKPHDAKSTASKPGEGNPQQARGENKQGGSPQEQKQAGEGKQEGKPTGDPKESRAEAKAQPNGQQREQAAEKKGQPGSSAQCECKGGGKNPSEGGRQGTAKEGKGQEGSGGGEFAAEGKPGTKGDGAGGDDKRAEGKPQPGKGGPHGRPEDATAEDVARLARNLQQGDDRQRRDAHDRLEQIRDRAKDPQAREGAADTLKKDGEAPADTSEAKRGPKNDGGAPQPKGGDGTAEGKEGKDKGGDSGSAKKEGGQPDGRQGEGKDGKQGGDGRDGKGREPNGTAKGPRPRGGSGNDPGNGAPGDRSTAGRGSPNDPLPPPGNGGKPSTHRPSMLQLEEFKKKVDKKVLEDAKLSEEDYRRFLKAYEEAARRQKDTPRADRPPEATTPTPLPSMRGQARDPTVRTPDDLRGEGRALPPPAYRDAYREFTKQFSRPPEKK